MCKIKDFFHNRVKKHLFLSISHNFFNSFLVDLIFGHFVHRIPHTALIELLSERFLWYNEPRKRKRRRKNGRQHTQSIYIGEHRKGSKRKYPVGGVEISRFRFALCGGRSRPLDCGQIHILGRLRGSGASCHAQRPRLYRQRRPERNFHSLCGRLPAERRENREGQIFRHRSQGLSRRGYGSRSYARERRRHLRSARRLRHHSPAERREIYRR